MDAEKRDWAEERARALYENLGHPCDSSKSLIEEDIQDIANALRQTRQEALEEAAKKLDTYCWKSAKEIRQLIKGSGEGSP